MDQSINIMILSHYFYPEIGAAANRMYDHAQVWAEKGANIVVITNNPNYPNGRLLPGYKNINQKETIVGVNVVRIKTYISPNTFLDNIKSLIL